MRVCRVRLALSTGPYTLRDAVFLWNGEQAESLPERKGYREAAMSEEREPHVFALAHGFIAWMPSDPDDKRELKFFHTRDGVMAWLPYPEDVERAAEIIDIRTWIGPVFWQYSQKGIAEVLAGLREEIEGIEVENPHADLGGFVSAYLPLLLVECLQDAARQALREVAAIVKAKGLMLSQVKRAKYLESVADVARLASLQRFQTAGLYQPLKRGERERLTEFAEIIERFLGERTRLKDAIKAIRREGKKLTLRALARGLNLGEPHKLKTYDTGIQKLETILKKQCPGMSPGEAIAALEAEDRSEGEKGRKIK